MRNAHPESFKQIMNQILQREIRTMHYNAYCALFKLLEDEVPELDLDKLLKSVELDRSHIHDLTRPLDPIALYRLCHALEEQNILPGASLKWPLNMDLYGHGLLSYSLLSNKTFGQMLTTMDQVSIATFPELGSTHTSVKGDSACIQIEIPESFLAYQRELVNDWMCTILLYAKKLLPEGAPTFNRLLLQYDKPGYSDLYSEIFECPVRFNESENAIYFPRHLLDLSLNRVENLPCDLTPLLSNLAAESIGYQQCFADQVSQFLIKNPDIPSIRIEDIAAAFNMSTVSFRRKLYEEGTSYKKLLGKLRFMIAKNYLENTRISLQEIAYMVGYQQTCSFHRAFKEQFGITPKEYREQHDLAKIQRTSD